jgi:hypothetical protein
MSVMDEIVARIQGTQDVTRSEILPPELPANTAGLLRNDGSGGLDWLDIFGSQADFTAGLYARGSDGQAFAASVETTTNSGPNTNTWAGQMLFHPSGAFDLGKSFGCYASIYSALQTGHTCTLMAALWAGMSGPGSTNALTADQAGVYVTLETVHATNLYGVWITKPTGTSAIQNSFGLWIGDQSNATNGYAIWYDGPGNAIWRLKADGVVGYYNKDYATRYTPGGTDFERIVTQWNANVAEIGTEKGADGGTLRPLKLLGDDVRLPVKEFAALGAPPDGTVVYCSDGKVTGPTDNTITDTGGGALAIRIAGAWKAIQ